MMTIKINNIDAERPFKRKSSKKVKKYTKFNFIAMELSQRTVIAFLLTIALLSSHHLAECQKKNATINISTHDALVVVEQFETFAVQLNGLIDKEVNVTLKVSHEGLVQLEPKVLKFGPNSGGLANVKIIGQSAGHVEITASAKPDDAIDTENLFVRVVVAVSTDLITISSAIGWCYFVAWSVSFYPQIYTNFKRKSVVGLNFDFLSLNIVGFILYGMFNIGLYLVPEIQDEYARRFPRGLNPVQLNDVFFACHAVFATLITIFQCFAYERADQRVSMVGRSLLSLFAVCGVLSAVLATVKIIHWLDFLYICSYIKLTITLIKYLPQAYMNYQRKSTIGWSIGNVLLDFTGGTLSMLQMMLNAHNYDDWVSIFGDPTKFGLGLFSVMFDILFLLQHYVFYREPKDKLTGHV
ncbi:cystinosin homolog isoform X2 [Contarinia nasturtii]|uniref:cystinosin homolog isoform X2 n=1 Tax=Contarinia nasturtii TaxID=265458 RepID=UPI0012D3CFB8|nr:cystinosin homolog isoform X2 [Contarinia nasturtii]